MKNGGACSGNQLSGIRRSAAQSIAHRNLQLRLSERNAKCCAPRDTARRIESHHCLVQ
jgi:hypothetical protein